MIRCTLVLVAACSTQARPAELPAPRPVARAVVAGELPPAPIVRSDDGRGGAEAPPAGAITILATTADGSAAVTADDGGGVRLWPALDGTQEPRVVVVPEPHALAIARRDTGFAIGVLDAGGGLYIANVDGRGRARSHVTLPIEPAYIGLAMTAAGLLAWRADQIAVLLDADGAAKGQLGTQPGERIVGIAERGGHAFALLERGGKRGVRAMTLAPMAWGDWFDAGEAEALPAVSPSGARLALLHRNVVDVLDARGKLVESVTGLGTDRIGFLDDATLVYATRSGLAFHANGRTVGPRDATGAVLAVGGGRAISAAGGELAIATATQTQYLGYGVVAPSVAQPAIDGQLVIGLGAAFVTLDRSLRAVGEPTFPVPAGTRVADLRWLGGDAWAVEASDVKTGETSLVLVGGGTTQVVRSGLTAVHVMRYEPATKLLTLSLGDAPAIYRFESGKLTRVAAGMSTSSQQLELVPLDPARAGGDVLVSIAVRGDRSTARWLRDPTKLSAAASPLAFDGVLAGADAAGHVFVWEKRGDATRLAVYAHGARVGVLPADASVSVAPAPTGDRVVEIGARDVSLVSIGGKRVWSTAIEGATEAHWLSDGALAVITAAGIARLDPATGAITAARCGWQFSLAHQPHPPTPELQPVCAALEASD